MILYFFTPISLFWVLLYTHTWMDIRWKPTSDDEESFEIIWKGSVTKGIVIYTSAAQLLLV